MKKLVLSTLVALPLVGCGGLFENVTPKSVKDVAYDACLLFGAENPDQLQGYSVKEFCSDARRLKPFVDHIVGAQQGTGVAFDGAAQ